MTNTDADILRRINELSAPLRNRRRGSPYADAGLKQKYEAQVAADRQRRHERLRQKQMAIRRDEGGQRELQEMVPDPKPAV